MTESKLRKELKEIGLFLEKERVRKNSNHEPGYRVIAVAETGTRFIISGGEFYTLSLEDVLREFLS